MNTNPINIISLRERCKEAGLAVIQYDDRPIHSYPYDTPWLDDPDFSELYNKVKENTLVDRVRCYALANICDQVRHLPGDVIEIGVWRGGTGAILASKLPNKTVFLADTFTGVVKSSSWEHYRDSAHSDTSIQIVRHLFEDQMNLKNYQILHGSFPEETATELGNRPLALVHIDVDVYLSAKDTFEHIWSQLVTGGIVVFDDYGFMKACSGIKRLIDEISVDPDKIFIHNLNAHAYVIKCY